MSVFLSAFLFIVIFALAGRRVGAIRGVVGILGITVGAMAALPLSPIVAPLMTKAGSTNLLWNWLLPPILVFLAFQLIFSVLAMLVHQRVMMFYKYKATDEVRHRWERMNARVGVAVGVGTAIGYTLVLGTVVYTLGYLTHQLPPEPGQPEPRALRILNQLRADQSATGFDRTIAALDPTPKGFYAAADLVGLLYHNPSLQGRLGDYPALLELAEHADIKALVADIKFNEFLLSKPGFFAIIEHPRIKALAANPEVVRAIESLVPADLLQFVRTGQSELFGGEPILGRWVVSVAASVAQSYRENPAMTSGDVHKYRQRIEAMTLLNFIATPDHKAILRGAGANDSGTWQKGGAGYTMGARGPQGLNFTEATLTGGRLVLRAPGDSTLVVFDRAQ